jgi:hypothetical protein
MAELPQHRRLLGCDRVAIDRVLLSEGGIHVADEGERDFPRQLDGLGRGGEMEI